MRHHEHDHVGPEEFADTRRRSLSPLTAYRFALVKHLRCACSEPAKCLMGETALCSDCSNYARTLRRFRRMTSGE